MRIRSPLRAKVNAPEDQGSPTVSGAVFFDTKSGASIAPPVATSQGFRRISRIRAGRSARSAGGLSLRGGRSLDEVDLPRGVVLAGVEAQEVDPARGEGSRIV